MKKYEFKLPDIGEGVTEGEIVKWLVAPGEVVEEDQPMVEVMTDKATVTITSPRAGKILETCGAEGTVVAVHAALVVFDVSGEDAPVETTASAVGDLRENLPGMATVEMLPPRAPTSPKAVNGKTRNPRYYNERPLATPATRRLARELGVDLRTVPPSGPNGRVTMGDVHTRCEPHGYDEAGTGSAPPDATSALPAPSTSLRSLARDVRGAGDEVRIPLRGLRRRIFDGMARSIHTAAHCTFVEECDVTALKAARDRLRSPAEASGVKLTYLPFFVKATVAALKRHPILNSAFDESAQEIVEKHYYDIGIAMATDAGLVVPVLRGADQRSLLDIAREIDRLAEDARGGHTRPEDVGGSTFSITSLGQQGGLFATPILNHPEVAILGVHRMKQKPVVRGGQIVIGDVMLISLSFDHRIIDGDVGAAFAYELISFIEEPARLLLDMV